MDDLSKIILGTGSYKNILSGNTLSITGDGGHAWGYFGPSYKKLAPRLSTYTSYSEKYEELLKLDRNTKEYINYRRKIEDEYIKSYYDTRLKDLYVPDFLEMLYKKYGENIILLCHEDVDDFCHRRLVADYIELKTGIYIPEISVDSMGNVKKINPIRYKNRLKSEMNRW